MSVRALFLASFAVAALIINSAPAAGIDSSAGDNIFKSHCILCHGTDATGNTALGKQLKARNLHSAIVQKKPDAALKKIITDGEGNMPSFAAQLTSAQIDEVLNYLRHLPKIRSDSMPPR